MIYLFFWFNILKIFKVFMKKILLTAGPIPSRLDSVKFITNRFKGGLSLKLADFLADKGCVVTVLCWKFSGIKQNEKYNVIYVDDVIDYFNKVLAFEAEMYILSAAVANLMPSNPYDGKFPSHLYKVGEKFNVEFEIAPRVIDEIKNKYPRASLVGYKLYDGSRDDLIKAAKKTLFDSKANLVFANSPQDSKDKKIVLTQDGALYDCSFNEHCELIYKLFNEKFYQTKLVEGYVKLSEDDKYIIENYPKHPEDGRVYGCFAVRQKNGFITTTRGKNGGAESISLVTQVDHDKQVVYASGKATLNAPLLDKILSLNPNINYVIHSHDIIGKIIHDAYEFPGSLGDLNFATKMNDGDVICLPKHGYIAGFESINSFKNFLREKHEQ